MLTVFNIDPRVERALLPSSWDAGRRELYLLRPEIRRPLSIDRSVWPSDAGAGGELVACALLVPDEDDEARALLSVLRPEVPIAPATDWIFLGYDVADSGFTSGLSNCGFGQDVHGLRAEWGTRLNAFGLFDSAADALAFARLSDQRIPEHATFFAFGLWST